MFRLAILLLLALAPVFGARAETALPVVATFSILGDIAKAVGGDRVAVQTLVGPNGDAHGYTPKPTDAKKLAAAKLIVVNGLDFERWLDRLMDSVSPRARIVQASRGVTPRPAAASSENASDPHAWQAVANVEIYVTNIRDALVETDPNSKDFYMANAAAYGEQLKKLDRDIREAVARIPAARRTAVTPHPSFAYFGAAYGLKFISPHQIGSEAETSAKTVAGLVDTIRRERVSALFVENGGDARLMQQIASETGAKLGGALYSDALTDARGPAPTYLAMMRQNMKTIAQALSN